MYGWDPHNELSVGEVILLGALCNVVLFYAWAYDLLLFGTVLGVLSVLFWLWVLRGALFGFAVVANAAVDDIQRVISRWTD